MRGWEHRGTHIQLKRRQTMAARRAHRRGRGSGKGNQIPLFIACGVAVVLVGAICWKAGIFGGKSARGLKPTPNFRVADYRRDGSRFASSGNVYVFDGRVESIETVGNARLVSISITNKPGGRLPLFIPGDVKLRVNITRGDRFLFEATCRTGKGAHGEQVKGILVVRNVQTL